MCKIVRLVCAGRKKCENSARTVLIVGCVGGGRVGLFRGKEFVTAELNEVLALRAHGGVKGVGG